MFKVWLMVKLVHHWVLQLLVCFSFSSSSLWSDLSKLNWTQLLCCCCFRKHDDDGTLLTLWKTDKNWSFNLLQSLFLCVCVCCHIPGRRFGHMQTDRGSPLAGSQRHGAMWLAESHVWFLLHKHRNRRLKKKRGRGGGMKRGKCWSAVWLLCCCLIRVSTVSEIWKNSNSAQRESNFTELLTCWGPEKVLFQQFLSTESSRLIINLQLRE